MTVAGNVLFLMLKFFWYNQRYGRVAQLGERFLRKEEVAGSIPVTSTNF